jgi:hypothetical protein
MVGRGSCLGLHGRLRIDPTMRVRGVCAFHEDPPCIKRRVSRRWAGGRPAARGRANVPEGVGKLHRTIAAIREDG